mmetsp:Transcript_2178/g.5114  ORF Transcript_2178/g.5114 Transcript_2178/m.5114 type:complete len:129 (+) Transcript_2178:622-1008(+)
MDRATSTKDIQFGFINIAHAQSKMRSVSHLLVGGRLSGTAQLCLGTCATIGLGAGHFWPDGNIDHSFFRLYCASRIPYLYSACTIQREDERSILPSLKPNVPTCCAVACKAETQQEEEKGAEQGQKMG